MKIISISFEEPLLIDLYGEKIDLRVFKTLESDQIKFGINAPLAIQVHREEVYKLIKQQIPSHELP